MYDVLHHQCVRGSICDESPCTCIGVPRWVFVLGVPLWDKTRTKGIVHAHDGGAPLHGGDDVVDGPHD
jgi:hypothetical protein